MKLQTTTEILKRWKVIPDNQSDRNRCPELCAIIADAEAAHEIAAVFEWMERTGCGVRKYARTYWVAVDKNYSAMIDANGEYLTGPTPLAALRAAMKEEHK